MALPADATRLLIALWQAKNASREVTLSSIARDLGFGAIGMLSAYTALERYRYARGRGAGAEPDTAYPIQAELTPAGVAAAAAIHN